MYTLPSNISELVRAALSEDIGSGDITAELLSDRSIVIAAIQSREEAVICGIPWANEVFAQIDNNVRIEWSIDEGELVEAGTQLATINGPVRAVLTGERTALNFLQALSGTATKTRKLVDLIANSSSSLLDTRKTLPGLRAAQKYAVRVGGGVNHRQGLFDAFLIKENHITASGGINAALAKARKLNPNKDVGDDYLKWMNDYEVHKYTEQKNKKHTIKEIKKFVKEKNKSKNEFLYGIFFKKKHIGNIKLGPIRFVHKSAEISYFIGKKELWGKGYTNKAIKLLIKKTDCTL